MNAVDQGAAPTVSEDECEHLLHQWPITGPQVDYTCARCGKHWRLPWRLAMVNLIDPHQEQQ